MTNLTSDIPRRQTKLVRDQIQKNVFIMYVSYVLFGGQTREDKRESKSLPNIIHVPTVNTDQDRLWIM